MTEDEAIRAAFNELRQQAEVPGHPVLWIDYDFTGDDVQVDGFVDVRKLVRVIREDSDGSTRRD